MGRQQVSCYSSQALLWRLTEFPRLDKPEFQVDFQFRATGPERGGGNLQIWYTKEGQSKVGTSSIYTAGAFDGFVLVADTYGGRVSPPSVNTLLFRTLSFSPTALFSAPLF